MTTFRGIQQINADVTTIRNVLLNPSAIPRWNPAITATATDETRASAD